jgi:hypothetical protein
MKWCASRSSVSAYLEIHSLSRRLAGLLLYLALVLLSNRTNRGM